MARKRAWLDRAGYLTGRDCVWAAIRALAATNDAAGDTSGTFSPIEVMFLAGTKSREPISRDTVMKYLRGLEKAEPPYVAVASAKRGESLLREVRLYRLVRDVGVDAPLINEHGKPFSEAIALQQIWTAAKALREFDRVELTAAASTPACPLKPDTVRRYLRQLELARYVSVSEPSRRNGISVSTLARYRFNRSMNTGPRAPIVCGDKKVVDANTGREVYAPPSKGGRECKTT